MRAILADNPLGDGDAGAVNDPMQAAKARLGQRQCRLHALFIGDVGLGKDDLLAQLPGERLAGRGIDIGNDDVRPRAGEVAHAGGTQPGSPSGDEKGMVQELHSKLFSKELLAG